MTNKKEAKNFFDVIDVIPVTQPLGGFYVFKISAIKLIKLTFSMAVYKQNGKLSGVQRKLKDDRIRAIAQYSKTTNATFPNSIIISANFDEDGRFVEDERVRWCVIDNKLYIPKEMRLASIIDGQHRIEGIKLAITQGDFQDFELLCSVYLDMPFSEQAEVFTSINYNQKKVDKSIAYELFGYDLENTDKQYWSPDTLAIYLTRILNNDDKSPLKSHIHTSFECEVKNKDWFVSTACIVEAISLLVTTDATRDRYHIHQPGLFNKGRKKLLDLKVKAPLRSLYIEGKDKDIYDIIYTYLNKINDLGWFSNKDFVTTKTIGFLAIFEVLRDILNINEVNNLSSIDLSFLDKIPLDSFKKEAFSFSGIGKSQIKKIIMDKYQKS